MRKAKHWYLLRNTYSKRKDMILTGTVMLFLVLLARMILAGLSVRWSSGEYVFQTPSVADVLAVIGMVGSYVWKRGVDVRYRRGSDGSGETPDE